MHPLVWGAYVLHGDPNAGISSLAPGSSAAELRGWPALATRFLATRAPEDREALLAAPGVPVPVASWASDGGVAEDALAEAAVRLLDGDPEGAAVCRILLALARLERDGGDLAELDVAYLAAAALEDGYAVLHVLAAHRGAWERRHPGGAQAIRDTAGWWLSALEGDRAALAPLAALPAQTP